MISALYDLQRQIYARISEIISNFSSGGDFTDLLAILPMGILFGAAHALTPGHSKAVLSSYVIGNATSVGHALDTSLVLATTHVATAVVISILALPLVSRSLSTFGQTPEIELVSRNLLILIGLWMILRSYFKQNHHGHESKAMGIIAGLIPCPLTLFVMTYATGKGVLAAGLLFSVTMLLGVATTLTAVALMSVFFRKQLLGILQLHPRMFDAASRIVEAIAGMALVTLAFREILN